MSLLVCSLLFGISHAYSCYAKGHWYEDLEYSATNTSDLNPFFYGVTLLHRPKELTYQADAISANLQLNKTHYVDQHIYRVEWEPPEEDGSGGYIKWYTDGEMIFGIRGSSLAIMQTEIPSEPMYLLMNTAVSSSWGFPAPCPENCGCECYECGNPACACALPVGYCENFPASMEIDYVRVYQALNDSKHYVGCSPEHRPTDLFIKGHAKRYMAAGQNRVLEPIQRGGGACVKNSDCGSDRSMGSCSLAGACVCTESYTGPNCKAHAGHDQFDTNKQPSKFRSTYSQFSSLHDQPFEGANTDFCTSLLSFSRSVRNDDPEKHDCFGPFSRRRLSPFNAGYNTIKIPTTQI